MKTKHFYFFVLLTIGVINSPLLAQQTTPQKGSTHIAIKKSRQLGRDGFVWYKVKKGNLYGAEDADGKIILPIKYPVIYYTSEGYFEVGDKKVRGAYSRRENVLFQWNMGAFTMRVKMDWHIG